MATSGVDISGGIRRWECRRIHAWGHLLLLGFPGRLLFPAGTRPCHTGELPQPGSPCEGEAQPRGCNRPGRSPLLPERGRSCPELMDKG